MSDLHTHQGTPTDGKSPSYLSALPKFSGSKQNPLQDAIELFSSNGLTADWVICPGDIADKNDGVSARIAWSTLEKLRKKVQARKLIGTVGNHDVDSRREDNEQRPDDSLKNLDPLFPFSEKRFSERFWANHYVIWRDQVQDATLVVLNTCVLHGVAVPPAADPEHLRGYVTQQVIDSLRQQLPGKLSKFNILLMHHHAQQHPWLQGDASHAINGPLLLEALRETNAFWLVIHGHLHLPNLSYADANANAPVILSAGSVAARTYPVRGRTPRNQMYLIEFDRAASEIGPGQARARIFTWNWAPAVGWTNASRDSGLPRISGFGFRGNLDLLAQQASDMLAQLHPQAIRWEQLVEKLPLAQFLIPDDLDSFVQRLEATHQVVVDYDRWQVPSVFARG